VLVVVGEEDKDIVSAELWDRGATGIVEENGRLRAFFDERDESVSAEFAGEWREEADRDWAREWSETWQPIELGNRLFLIPDWMQDPTPAGRVRIETHPGRAYGTGTSEATQLALLGLERHLWMGDTVLDVGTGTGILSVAAVKLGAAQVFACDIDLDAVEVADANIHRDDITVHLFAGSVRSVQTESMDTVVANINATAIALAAAELTRILKPDGRLVTSGFVEGDVPRVREALAGLDEVEKLDQNGWVSLVFRREAP
jgi:ribosomal protein L11 methyltransferase